MNQARRRRWCVSHRGYRIQGQSLPLSKEKIKSAINFLASEKREGGVPLRTSCASLLDSSELSAASTKHCTQAVKACPCASKHWQARSSHSYDV